MFLLYFRLFNFSDLYWVYLYFPVLFCLSVSVKWLAVKTVSEMTYTVSSGALNSTPSIHPSIHPWVSACGMSNNNNWRWWMQMAATNFRQTHIKSAGSVGVGGRDITCCFYCCYLLLLLLLLLIVVDSCSWAVWIPRSLLWEPQYRTSSREAIWCTERTGENDGRSQCRSR